MIDVDANGPVSEEQLAAAETELGVILPAPYRSWLRRTGGGEAVELYVIEQVDGSFGTFSGIDGTYAITLQYDGLDESLPRDLIRIADGDGGSVALEVRGDDIGSVWWSDHDTADELGADEPSYDYVTRLADDFDAFLAAFD